MEELRRPLFIVAVALILIALLVEAGSAAFLQNVSSRAAALDAPTPGFGVPYTALIEGELLFTILLMGIALLVPERVHGRVQGIATLIFSFLMLLGSILLILIAVALLFLMLALFLAVPFGTIAYLAIYGDFDREGASITLSLAMTLKLFAAGFLVFAHQRFLQNKGLVLIILTSLVATFLVGFLHGLVPGILVSIVDALAGIIVGILAAIWALVLLIGSIVSVVKAIH